MSDDKVTTGEIYRRLVDMDERYEKKLDSIEGQVRKTNGRTTTLEESMRRADRELQRLNSAVFQRPSNTPTPNSLPVVTPEGESLSIKISPKMWTLLASVVTALSVFGPILAEWVKKAFGL